MSSQKGGSKSDGEGGGSDGFGWLGLGVATLFGGMIGAVLAFLSLRRSEEPQCNASAGPTADTSANSERQETFRNRPLTREPCAVCLDGINVVVTLPCGHRFHAHCVEDWIRDNSTCPVCRMKITPEQMKYSV